MNKKTSNVSAFQRFSVSAFTLVELMVVIAIIAILIGVVVVVAGGVRQQAKEQLTRSTITTVTNAMLEYKNLVGTYPEEGTQGNNPTQNEMDAAVGYLMNVPATRDLLQKVPSSVLLNDGSTWELHDGWGRRMYYHYHDDDNNKLPLIKSGGRDGVIAEDDPTKGADDITSGQGM